MLAISMVGHCAHDAYVTNYSHCACQLAHRILGHVSAKDGTPVHETIIACEGTHVLSYPRNRRIVHFHVVCNVASMDNQLLMFDKTAYVYIHFASIDACSTRDHTCTRISLIATLCLGVLQFYSTHLSETLMAQ